MKTHPDSVYNVQPNYIMDGQVTKIRDGDTIEVTVSPAFKWQMLEVPLRLRGIDCPETRSSDPEERKRGQAAKAFCEKLVMGKPITIQTFKTSGGNYRKTFDRYVADVYYWDEDGKQCLLNEKLLNAGHAVVMEM